MLGLSALGTALNVYGAIQQGKAQSNAYKYQAGINRRNAALANTYAEDSRARTRATTEQHRTRVRQTLGRQRAAIAAAGFDVGQSDAITLLASTAAFGELDKRRIVNIGEREAYGYSVQGINYQSQADLYSYNARVAKQQGYLNAGGSLISGGLNFYSTGKDLGLFPL